MSFQRQCRVVWIFALAAICLWGSRLTAEENNRRGNLQRAFAKGLAEPLAQQPAINRIFVEERDSDDELRLSFPSDRRTNQRLAKAHALLEEHKFSEAVVLLQKLLDQSEDFFLHIADAPSSKVVSAKSHVETLLGELPTEGRRLYELQFGAQAARMLDEALSAHDIEALEEVARRFFHTQAGYRATHRLGTHHLDRSRPLAALSHFHRLRKLPRASNQWEPLLSLKTAVCWQLAGFPEQSQLVVHFLVA